MAQGIVFWWIVSEVGNGEIGAVINASVGMDFLSVFLPMFALITLGGAVLIAGYMLGYVHLKNIWIVTAISVGSILIVEPLLAWLLFHQMPTLGAGIGLTLGALGVLAALFL